MNALDANEIRLFAEVILPLPLQKNYTYGIPQELEQQAAPGKRVEIQFGRRKIYAGLIKRLHGDAPGEYRIKPILSVLDAEPIVSAIQLKFWEWMAAYYLCSEGEVMNAALPAGFKLESETAITLHPGFTGDFTHLTDREYVVAEALMLQRELQVEDISKILNRRHVYPVIDALIRKKVAVVKEQLIERFKPRIETYVRLHTAFHEEENLRSVFDELEKKAVKQLQVLMYYLHLCQKEGKGYIRMPRFKILQENKNEAAALQSLIRKGILVQEKIEVSRLKSREATHESLVATPAQQKVLEQIQQQAAERHVVLLHGVTGSGKTHVYMELIKQTLDGGKQALYLLPEIALTAQIVERLRSQFGTEVGIYHSRFNQQERVEIWNKMLHGEYRLILGARSSLFLPFEKLGLVIVDEEHDASYKQDGPAPRYHGRDAGIYLASMFGARTVLGSATPSLESYTHAKSGKYALAELPVRYGNASLPEIEIIDVKAAAKRKDMHSHFSARLLDEIKAALQRDEQIILFQNRRGYAPYLECNVCHWVAMCPNCDVHLTYHRFQNELKCHYCNHRRANHTQCPACGSSSLRISGFGTEKIEDELRIFFPDAAISRLDYDSARSRQGYQKIIHDFESGRVKILVGTQMVTKGLDFENVSLVGIMNADQLMGHLDFRTAERGFQLMSQVSGRAGRKKTNGKVLIQTSHPQSPLLRFVLNHDYAGFYQEEMEHRKKFVYPPFTRLVHLTFRHGRSPSSWEAARLVANAVQQQTGVLMLGPAEPPVGKVNNKYLVQITIKPGLAQAANTALKQIIRQQMEVLQQSASLRSVEVEVDVDPQ